LFAKLSAAQRKIINWLGFLVVIGIGLMLIQAPKQETNRSTQIRSPAESAANHSGSSSNYEEQIEEKLIKILSQISGVGDVEVFVTLERSAKIVIAESITEDMREGERRLTKSPVTLRADGGNKEIPLVLEEYEPELRGVLVAAEGAADPQIRYRIFQAVQTVLQLPMYKIEVQAKVK